MKYEEAVEALKLINTSRVHPFYNWEEMCEVRDIAIQAIEKQIPKEPSYYGEEDDGKILCPYCETDLYDDRECGFNNCPYCGQAINWEGAEDNE